MRPKDIDRFFRVFAQDLQTPVKIILTGGGVALLRGGMRVTYDLDFQIQLPSRPKERNRCEQALRKAAQVTGITPQYAEDIDRWSSIAMPRPLRKPILYKRFGLVRVYLLDPLLWSIGKLTRFLESDIEDLGVVLKKVKPNPRMAVQVWGQALAQSPASSVQAQFKQQVLYFLKMHARLVWGKQVNPESLAEIFLASSRRRRY